MVSGAAKPRRSNKEQMEDRISRFVSGWFKTLILKPGSSVSTNHRTTKALPEGNLFGSWFSLGMNFTRYRG